MEKVEVGRGHKKKKEYKDSIKERSYWEVRCAERTGNDTMLILSGSLA